MYLCTDMPCTWSYAFSRSACSRVWITPSLTAGICCSSGQLLAPHPAPPWSRSWSGPGSTWGRSCLRSCPRNRQVLIRTCPDLGQVLGQDLPQIRADTDQPLPGWGHHLVPRPASRRGRSWSGTACSWCTGTPYRALGRPWMVLGTGHCLFRGGEFALSIMKYSHVWLVVIFDEF